MKSTTMIPSIGKALTPTLRSALRSAGALGSLASLRIGAKIYAGFCLVLFLLVLISGASWLGLQQTTGGMETSQQSSDAAITTAVMRSEEHTSELQTLMRISYAGLCLKKKQNNTHPQTHNHH